MSIEQIRDDLNLLGNKKKAKELQRFFKTGPGEYGEGDTFLGIRVPETRKLAKRYRNITIDESEQLLQSSIHEERLLALIILVQKTKRGDESHKKRFVNNWDLVDASAEHVVGAYILKRNKKPLYRLAKSKGLWDRRIAIMSTFHFIKQNEFSEALKISDILLLDLEDLIHKAVGWMLREIGKRHLATEEDFLKTRYHKMPRTMLRYAIEKFPEPKRQAYLKGNI